MSVIMKFIDHLMPKTWVQKKHLEIMKHRDLIIPEWLIEESIQNKHKKFYYPQPIKQTAGENNKLDEKELKTIS